MKFFLKFVVLIGLLIITINAISGHEFNTENYINNLSENLKPIPRLSDDELEFVEYPESPDFDIETLGTFFTNCGIFFNIVWVVISYPVKLLIWLFNSLYVVFSGIIWWQ